eukprot:Hpha_TRINITY_DN15796_c0_g1::TRINITY_DN15796_c0_g1_i1::g.37740::m.37740
MSEADISTCSGLPPGDAPLQPPSAHAVSPPSIRESMIFRDPTASPDPPCTSGEDATAARAEAGLPELRPCEEPVCGEEADAIRVASGSPRYLSREDSPSFASHSSSYEAQPVCRRDRSPAVDPDLLTHRAISSSTGDKLPAVMLLHEVTVTTTRNKREEVLLRRVTASVPPGSLTAVVGPSGAGKTTLLNALGGRITPTRGGVFIGGRVGHVMSDCRFHAWQTVRETLQFAARSRGGEKVKERVALVMQQTGLTECADRLVGGDGGSAPCISGGQRRRLALAVELLFDRDIILCDEPTSGLDTVSTEALVQTLRDLVDGGDGQRSVVCTIHQVSMDVLRRFTHLILVTRGRVVYCGDPKEAELYLMDRTGMVRDQYTSVPDWWLHVFQTADNEVLVPWEPGSTLTRCESTANAFELRDFTGQLSPSPSQRVDAGIITSTSAVLSRSGQGQTSAWRSVGVGWLEQVWLLLLRMAQSAFRDKAGGLSAMLKVMADAAFYAMFFPRMGRDAEGMSALIAAVSLLPMQQHLETCVRCSMPLLRDRPITVREYTTGMFCLSAYSFASLLWSMASQFVWTFLLFSIFYPAAGLRPGFVPFLLTLAALVLLLLFSQAFVQVLASPCRGTEGVKRVHTLMFAVSFPLMLSNFGVRPYASPWPVRPFFEATPFRHCLDAMAIIQLRDVDSECDGQGNSTICGPTGNEFLVGLGLEDTSLVQPFMVLVSWVIVIRVVATRTFKHHVRTQVFSGQAIAH